MLQQRLSNRDAKKKINLLDFIKLRNKMAATLTCFQHKIKDMAFRRTPLAFPSHDFNIFRITFIRVEKLPYCYLKKQQTF